MSGSPRRKEEWDAMVAKVRSGAMTTHNLEKLESHYKQRNAEERNKQWKKQSDDSQGLNAYERKMGVRYKNLAAPVKRQSPKIRVNWDVGKHNGQKIRNNMSEINAMAALQTLLSDNENPRMRNNIRPLVNKKLAELIQSENGQAYRKAFGYLMGLHRNRKMRQSPKRQTSKHQSPKRQTSKHQSPKRQTPKHQSPKRQTPNRQSSRTQRRESTPNQTRLVPSINLNTSWRVKKAPPDGNCFYHSLSLALHGKTSEELQQGLRNKTAECLQTTKLLTEGTKREALVRVYNNEWAHDTEIQALSECLGITFLIWETMYGVWTRVDTTEKTGWHSRRTVHLINRGNNHFDLLLPAST